MWHRVFGKQIPGGASAIRLDERFAARPAKGALGNVSRGRIKGRLIEDLEQFFGRQKSLDLVGYENMPLRTPVHIVFDAQVGAEIETWDVGLAQKLLEFRIAAREANTKPGAVI